MVRRASRWRARALVLGLVAAAVAIWAQPAAATGGLTVTKTATGSSERTVDYDWTIQKSVAPGSLTLGTNASGGLDYSLAATRTVVSDNIVNTTSGEICVTNDGTTPTVGLAIDETIRAVLPDMSQVEVKTIVITPPNELGPGETGCVQYNIDFTRVPNAVRYTNHARAHATDFTSGNVTVSFVLPAPTLIEHDGAADVADAAVCPAGFTCTPSDAGPWHLTDSGTINYTTTVKNVSAPCGSTHDLDNTATLTEGDSGATRTSSASATLATPACGPACPQPAKFWKEHPELITPLLPIWLGTPSGSKSVNVTTVAQAVDILSKGGQLTNGTDKLMAQLLAAKLNIASGTSAGPLTSAAITAADVFLATNQSSGWNSLPKLTQLKVLAGAILLEGYNFGLLGPKECICKPHH
jgi:hypothetical protein